MLLGKLDKKVETIKRGFYEDILPLLQIYEYKNAATERRKEKRF